MKRWLAAVAVIAGLLPLALAHAADPGDGKITLQNKSVHWQGASWPIGVTAVAQRGVEPTCAPANADQAHATCDHFALTVDVPASYWKRHPGGVKVTASWADPNDKLEIAAYDEKGNFVGWGLSGGASSVVIKNAHGTYDIVVVPMLAPTPTSYVGFARIISVPPPAKHPSLGGPVAYRASPVPRLDPDHPPANKPVHYAGAPLRLVAHPVRPGAVEPTIGVDKHGTVYFNVRDTGVEVPTQGHVSPPRVYRSTDAGGKWRETGDIGADNEHFATGDPYLYVDRDYGRVFWADLIPTGYPTGAFLSFSDDGETWTNGAVSLPGVNDHETIVTAPAPKGSGLVALDPSFPKVVYYCVNQVSGTGCTRSLDGGRTFERVGEPLIENTLGCAVSTTGHLSSDRDGRIFLASSGCNVPLVGHSDDGGVTWTDVVVTRKIRAAYHDVETATDAAGNLYALWGGDDPSLPYLSVSRDHGNTWSTPVMVAAPGVHEASMLTLTAGARGHVAIGMVATTVADPGDNLRPWSYRVAVTQNALATSPTFVSNVATLSDTGERVVSRGTCCYGMYDFLDLKPGAAPDMPVWGSLSVACVKECVTKPVLPDGEDSPNNQRPGYGYAVQQVSGPSLGRAGSVH